jgi:putative phosphoesterase
MTIRVGLISDTHGLMRPSALAMLHEVAHIIHAGDIGRPDVLSALGVLAPVTAVCGNNDTDAWAAGLRTEETLELSGVRIYVLHDLKSIRLDPVAAGFRVVVSGHSHRPKVEERNGVLYVNPGSAGPRRFKLPISVGWLEIDRARVHAVVRTLDA